MRLWILILLSLSLVAGYQWATAPEPDEPLTFTRVRPEPQPDMQADEGFMWSNATSGIYLHQHGDMVIRNNVFYSTGSLVENNTIVNSGR
jgi:hypothetical protein